jgi:hypothetical protein
MIEERECVDCCFKDSCEHRQKALDYNTIVIACKFKEKIKTPSWQKAASVKI